MRLTHLAILVSLAGAVAFVGRSAGGEEEAPDAGRLFTTNCAHCHTIPDPGLRTDRAFIDQVHRTA